MDTKSFYKKEYDSEAVLVTSNPNVLDKRGNADKSKNA
jgi:hypothetical protein